MFSIFIDASSHLLSHHPIDSVLRNPILFLLIPFLFFSFQKPYSLPFQKLLFKNLILPPSSSQFFKMEGKIVRSKSFSPSDFSFAFFNFFFSFFKFLLLNSHFMFRCRCCDVGAASLLKLGELWLVILSLLIGGLFKVISMYIIFLV